MFVRYLLYAVHFIEFLKIPTTKPIARFRMWDLGVWNKKELVRLAINYLEPVTATRIQKWSDGQVILVFCHHRHHPLKPLNHHVNFKKRKFISSDGWGVLSTNRNHLPTLIRFLSILRLSRRNRYFLDESYSSSPLCCNQHSREWTGPHQLACIAVTYICARLYPLLIPQFWWHLYEQDWLSIFVFWHHFSCWLWLGPGSSVQTFKRSILVHEMYEWFFTGAQKKSWLLSLVCIPSVIRCWT